MKLKPERFEGQTPELREWGRESIFATGVGGMFLKMKNGHQKFSDNSFLFFLEPQLD